jgi:hypothetical protein
MSRYQAIIIELRLVVKWLSLRSPKPPFWVRVPASLPENEIFTNKWMFCFLVSWDENDSDGVSVTNGGEGVASLQFVMNEVNYKMLDL